MIRKDREIKNADEITAVLKKCDTLSIALQGEEGPYVIPVSFGLVQSSKGLAIYFHGARRGRKISMLEKDPRVCVEGHIFYRVEPTQQGITTRYESVIGFGRVEKVEGEELVLGLRSISEHYNYPGYPIDRCKGLPMTGVYKIVIEELTGKRNLPE